jgi:hypothetical protein
MSTQLTSNNVNEDEFQKWMEKNRLAPPEPSQTQTSSVPEYTGTPMNPEDIDTFRGDVGGALMNNLGKISGAVGGAIGLGYGIKKAGDIFGARPAVPTAMAQPAAQQVAQQTAQRMVANGPTATTPTGQTLQVQRGGLSGPATQPVAPTPTAAPATQGAFRTALGNAGRVGLSALNAAGPASMLALPYQMAGAERQAIQEDPFNERYRDNPYAMSVRSEFTNKPITTGQAGERNRRKAAYDAAERILNRGM